jgi:ABC-type Na+ transport system ATPase subunit NatA
MADASKFSQFLASKKIDTRRVLAASHQLESLTLEDRVIKLAKRRGKKEGADASIPKETRKPRSGRPVTERAMAAAVTGGTLSGPTKTRLLRAVNHLLEQKKQEKIELKTLF